MRRLKLLIEYDGANFCGWQIQPTVRTVQGVLETALSKVLNHEVRITGSGRTDTGVHASGQVAHVDTLSDLALENILNGVNSQCGDDVKLLDISEAEAGFHARFDAKKRTYEYRISLRYRPLLRLYTWFPDCTWEEKLIAEAVKILHGEHSFKAFSKSRPEEEGYLCKVNSAEWKSDGVEARFRITANRFMHRMVRGIVGALMDTGRGKLPLSEFKRMLKNPVTNGEARTAPSHGLTLVKIEY